MESKRLDNAALAAGISPSYINAHGKPQSIAAVTKQRLLDAMHRSTAATKVAVNPLPNVKIFTFGSGLTATFVAAVERCIASSRRCLVTAAIDCGLPCALI